ncbi:SpoIIE family protein phosphatase [Streptomyces sp. ASQP_92]|uniref:SpoIIE family protein phosphatase n=1 Tax=Streptomyces sp. ASQP_92 TaxID=2979116 RepID=UPI0021BF27F2|nr:SpoIIE family protein phosphatase [Streptomyces sp. ASQP_92]MCT9089980.1 SpoIIE family protein phosphatase [Streptomyces sp. ASQP_92]
MPDQAAVLASELASNIDKHARDGALYIQALPLGDGVEILAADRGPGMPELERCLADGYTTVGTLGAGLGAVSRIASDFTIRTRTGTGTYASARLVRPDQPGTAPQNAALTCLPADLEEHCGDAGAVMDTGTSRTAAVIDGLGHGHEAAEAAHSALRTFRTAAARSLPDILTAMHRTLRHTRGAAVGLLRLQGERAQYCAIGNIRAVALSPEGVHHRLTGQPGVVGWRMPTPTTHAFDLPAGTTALLHSDGIDARWTQDPALFVLRLPPPLLTAAVTHNHRNTRDDATVLAVRPPRRDQ